ncbi:hypothetical protein GS883_21740 [Rhodococcus hoagii]|nr:hypothetical protein [Prescottella equi]
MKATSFGGTEAAEPVPALTRSWVSSTRFTLRVTLRRPREYVTPEVAKDQLADLQSGIDLHVPVGTVHCVEVRPTDLPGSFALELTEKRPNGETVRYLQTISTSVRDGRTLIAASPRTE